MISHRERPITHHKISSQFSTSIDETKKNPRYSLVLLMGHYKFSPAMKTAIQLNNNGVLSLNRGDDEELAVRSFTEALGEMKAHVREQMIRGAGGHERSLAEMDAMDCCDASTSSGLPGASDFRAGSMPCAPISPGHHCYIFNRTITICPTSPVSPDCLPIHSACILLNMAIAYHRMAIKGRPMNLVKAERLYQMIVREITPSHHDATSVALHAVALNNLVDIHHRLSRFETSQRDVADLSSMICQLRRPSSGDSGAVTSHSAVLTESDIELMIMNVLTWTVPDAAAAA